MRRRLIGFVGVCFSSWAAAWAAPAQDTSTGEILKQIRSRPPAGVDLRDRAAVWDALVGPARLPVRCGTTVALALRQARGTLPAAAQPAVARLLAVPAPGRRLIAPDGFEVRLGAALPAALADENANGAPDALEQALEETARALRFWVEERGWLPPAESGAGRPVMVVLENLPEGLDGLALPDQEPERTFEEDATAALLVSVRLLSEPQALARTLTHQAAHAVLWSYSHRESPAWQEASAVALEIEARRDPAPYLDSFSERLQERARSLRGERLRLAQGTGLWALFLDLSRPEGDSGLRRLWEELAAVAGDNLSEASEATLSGSEEVGVGGEIATFLAWGLFTGERDDGRHFPFGVALRGGDPDAAHAEYPASGPDLRLALEPWSGSVIRLQTGRDPGGLRVQFQGGEHGRWSVLALFEGRAGGLRSAWLPVDADGRAEIRFPWRSLASTTLVVANSAAPGSPPAEFGYSAWLDPGYPFELSGLQAEPSADGVALRWTTDGETDMAGWNVYRSLSPLGGFVRVNRFPMPAGGDMSEPLHYLFLDSEAAPGEKYYYHLEGLTAGGFTERTPGVSARTPGKARPR